MKPLSSVRIKLPSFLAKNKTGAGTASGVLSSHGKTTLLFQHPHDLHEFSAVIGEDSFDFTLSEHSYHLDQKLTAGKISNLKQFSYNGEHNLIFNADHEGKKVVCIASIQKTSITSTTHVHHVSEQASIVSDFKHEGKWVMFYGDRAIRVAYSVDLSEWQLGREPVLIDASPLQVGDTFLSNHGIIVLYYKTYIQESLTYTDIYLALFDKKNPEKLLWKTQEPIWSQQKVFTNQQINIIGSVFVHGHLVTYMSVDHVFIYASIHAGFTYRPSVVRDENLVLKKHTKNPIISPSPDHHWEALNTFNPTAVRIDGTVHILYRAQGYDYISSVGYASSNDGFTLNEQLGNPVYSPTTDFDTNTTGSVDTSLVSGGGYGGCEDPRVTLIDNRVYMTYVAFDGWSPPRLALTSIHVDDFLKKRWLWSKPVLISAPGVVDKSGCLLPEKIRGKYVFLHRVFPNILVDYVDSLNFDGKGTWLQGQYSIGVREHMWDSRKIGAGAPPLKTKDGWLLIYYAVDNNDDSKYKIGAMILDSEHPEKVLYRSNHPILEPCEHYELQGFKPGIAYPCGAVILEDKLLVYYGGADSVVCVASTHLDAFLEHLKSQTDPELQALPITEKTL